MTKPFSTINSKISNVIANFNQLVNMVGDLSQLNTTADSDLVAAINELEAVSGTDSATVISLSRSALSVQDSGEGSLTYDSNSGLLHYRSPSALELQTLLNLGTAATADSSDFATAAQGIKADTAFQVPNLEATTLTDWNSVATTKTGFYYDSGIASNSPYSGEQFTGLYIAKSATLGSIIIFGLTSNRVFIRQFNVSWGLWREFNLSYPGTSTSLDNIGVGVIAVRFTNTATGAPSGYGTYTGLCRHYGTDTIRSQIVTINGINAIFTRQYNGSSWGSWVRYGQTNAAFFTTRAADGVNGQSISNVSPGIIALTNSDNPSLGVSLNGFGQLVFSNPGTYLIEATLNIHNSGGSNRAVAITLFDVTSGTKISNGRSALIQSGDAATITLKDVITITTPSTIEIQGISSGTGLLNSRATNLGPEIYNTVQVSFLG